MKEKIEAIKTELVDRLYHHLVEEKEKMSVDSLTKLLDAFGEIEPIQSASEEIQPESM